MSNIEKTAAMIVIALGLWAVGILAAKPLPRIPEMMPLNKLALWREGPLPEGTYDYGAVVSKQSTPGFLLGTFTGVEFVATDGKIVKAADVLKWNNAICSPVRE